MPTRALHAASPWSTGISRLSEIRPSSRRRRSAYPSGPREQSEERMSQVPNVTLHDGVEIPQLGFGVFQVPPDDTEEVVGQAFELGYRHIDTAAAYRNEKGVGRAVANSGIPREELFITTKLWNSSQGFDSALEAVEKSLGRLGMDYVDLYLIHWPVPSNDRFVDTWRAFEHIHAEGRA